MSSGCRCDWGSPGAAAVSPEQVMVQRTRKKCGSRSRAIAISLRVVAQRRLLRFLIVSTGRSLSQSRPVHLMDLREVLHFGLPQESGCPGCITKQCLRSSLKALVGFFSARAHLDARMDLRKHLSVREHDSHRAIR